MTRKDFLNKMDRVKTRQSVKIESNYSCHNISNVFECSLLDDSNVTLDYIKLFDLQDKTFGYMYFNVARNNNPYFTRIAAIELFEIIALEEKWYENY